MPSSPADNAIMVICEVSDDRKVFVPKIYCLSTAYQITSTIVDEMHPVKPRQLY